jgi:predicted DCC family thiol-disulfide oxidoreductase YuxK
LKYYGLTSNESQTILQNAPAYILNSDSIIVYYNKQYFIKSEAIFAIIKSLGGLFLVFNIFKIFPTKYLDKIYDFIALNRYRLFGKRTSCYLPKKNKN